MALYSVGLIGFMPRLIFIVWDSSCFIGSPEHVRSLLGRGLPSKDLVIGMQADFPGSEFIWV